jgi:hypothetical protein
MKTRKIRNVINLKNAFVILFLACVSLQVIAQDKEANPISHEEKKQVVDSIALFMAEKYVFPDKGKEMGDLVSKNFKNGDYDNVSDPIEFASRLSEDLLTINNDRHIGVRYMPEQIAMIKKADEDENNKELEEYEKKQREFVNFNFQEIKILPGNVGYLKFNGFMDASVAGPTAISAMNFLAHTNALIIDLRDNGGGSPSLIQLITTYFFEESEHLNSFYIRDGDQMNQFWTLTYVPGEKLLETDIYILTSRYTFSGAEEFTYNLKNMKRAIVVGETTGGGAHPVTSYIINDNFMVRVPFGKAVNPITKDNWEGTGIDPHVATTRDKAKDVAYVLALDSLIKKDNNEETKSRLQWVKDGLNAKLDPVSVDSKTLKSYAGTYGPRKLTFEDGCLYYQREDRPRMKMIPMSENLFMFDDIDYFRLRVIIENEKAIAVEGNYDNGRKDKNNRN